MEHRHRSAPARPYARPVWQVALLAGAILMGGLPILTGVVVIPDSRPAFTLDVCHPLGAVAYGLSQGEAPLIPAHTAAHPPEDSGRAHEYVAFFPPGEGQAPDPPPPKIA